MRILFPTFAALTLSLSLFAKSGITPQLSDPKWVSSLPGFAIQCQGTLLLTGPEKVAYNKVKYAVPDVFCCEVLNSDERATCLTEKAAALRHLAVFIPLTFNRPLEERLRDEDAIIPEPEGYPICVSTSEGGDTVAGKITAAKCELRNVGQTLSEFQRLLQEVD